MEEWVDRPMSRAELAIFLDRMADSLRSNPEEWENHTLEWFLEAWSAWVNDMDGAFRWWGEPVPECPSWKLIATMVLAASAYE